MINEESHALEVLELLHRKIKENESVLDEKSKTIIESIDSFYQSRGESKDYADKLAMINEINYAKAISGIANRQLSRYLLMLDKPYFGRLDFKNEWGELPYYFGIESLIDNEEIVVYDWRSPIANLYYDSIMGKASYESPNGIVKGELTLKRQYKFNKGKLIYYNDMIANVSDELLFDVLKNNNDMVMKNIVATIQKEQNQAIRFIDSKNILVLGVAGSGKTSIALHRIAYLMYKDALKYNSSRVCFITPNKVFFNYVDNVLPELGEDNVVTLTLNQIALVILKNDLYKLKLKLESKEDYFERVINDRLTIDYDTTFISLNEFLEKKMASLFNEKIGLKIKGLTFHNALFKELYFNKFKRRNYHKRKKLIKEFLLDRISIENKITLDVMRHVDLFMDKLLPEVSYYDLYMEFLKETRNDKHIFIKDNLRYEHVFPLAYVKLYFKSSSIFDKYNHLLVDEYQDLNIFEREVLNNVFNCSKTYLGDINQSLFKQSDFIDKFAGEVLMLNNSYRNSKPIFEFLKRIISTKGVNAINRDGADVEMTSFDTKEEMIKRLVKVIDEYKGHSLGIITKSFKDSKELYDKLKNKCHVNLLNHKGKDIKRGVVIGCVFLTKGLEFEKVIVYDASKENYKENIDKNYLYIACSRAMHELSLYYLKEATELLK